MNLYGTFKSKYNKDYLRKKLFEKYGNKTLGEIKDVKLIIPATDISNGTVFVFKSNYSQDFVRDENIKLVDAIISSCSAPTYFDPEYVNNLYLLSDGGLWANNPSLVCLVEALTRLEIPLDKIKMLSIGTGFGKNYYDPKLHDQNWGIINGWGPANIIDMILNLQSISSTNIAKLLLKDNYYRLNFETDNKLKLDDISTIDFLRTKADNTFTYEAANIRKFLDEILLEEK